MNKIQRKSNIELLRILSMFGVIMLHYNNEQLGGGLRFVEDSSVNYYILILLESIYICAVDLFMLISGFFSCHSVQTSVQKPVRLLLQTILFSFGYTLLIGIIKGDLLIANLIDSLVPANFFVILYITVYLLSPYLNLLYGKMDDRFIFIIFTLFSIEPTVVDILAQVTKREWLGLSTIGMYGSQWGYQICNFILMYFIGMYIEKNIENINKINTRSIFYGIVGTVVAISICACISRKIGFNRTIVWNYCNPLVIVEAIFAFVLFRRIEIGTVKWINKLASASFGVYLLHGYFLPHIKISWAVSQNLFVMLMHIILSSIGIYLICFLVNGIFDCLYRYIFSNYFKKIS